VIKVRRPDRKVLGIGRAYGRLCQECVGELLARPPTPEGIAAASGQADRESETRPTSGRRLRGR
jgi:hypothetical protein